MKFTKNLEIYMKSDASFPDCPTEDRCQLELIKESTEDNESLILEDVVGETDTKTLSIGMKLAGGGCDYKLNIGMSGSVTEYVDVRHVYNSITIRGIYDIGRGDWVDVSSFPDLSGSPSKPSITKALIASNDSEYSTFESWFNYNWTASAPSYTFSYGWYFSSPGSWDGGLGSIDPEYPLVNTSSSAYPDYRHFDAKYLSAVDDYGYYILTVYNVEVNNGPEFSTYDEGTRYRYEEFYRSQMEKGLINDSVIGQWIDFRFGYLGKYIANVSLPGTGDGVGSGSASTSHAIDIYVDEVLCGNYTRSAGLTFSYDGTYSVSGDQVRVTPDDDVIDAWVPSAEEGEVYTCILAGYTDNPSHVTSDDSDADFSVNDGYQFPGIDNNTWTSATTSIFFSNYNVRPAIQNYIPIITQISDLTVYSGTSLSIVEALQNGVAAKGAAMASAMDEFNIKVDTVHSGATAAIAVHATIYDMYKKAV